MLTLYSYSFTFTLFHVLHTNAKFLKHHVCTMYSVYNPKRLGGGGMHLLDGGVLLYKCSALNLSYPLFNLFFDFDMFHRNI